MASLSSGINQMVEKFKNKEYSRALGQNVSNLFSDMLSEMEEGVIYIHGPPNSGKSSLAKRIAYHFYKKGMDVDISFNFVSGYNALTHNQVLIIEDQHSKDKGNNIVDEYGLENYKIYAYQRHAIAIVIGLKPYVQHSFMHLQCESFREMKSTEGLQLILRVKDSYLGTVFISKAHSKVDDPSDVEEYYEFLDWREDIAKTEFYKTEIEAIIEQIDDKTEYLIKSIFPSRDLIETRPVKDPDDNAIEGIKLGFYGDIGNGKSTLAKIINAVLEQKYSRVHAVKHDRDIMLLYSKAWSKDPLYFCQYLHVEDATYSLPSTYEALQQHIRMRHLMNYSTGGTEKDKRTGIQHGVAVSSIAIHRLTGKAIAPEWRDNFKALFILNLPTLPWDRNYIKGLLKSSINYDFLVWLNRERNKSMVSGDKNRYHALLGIGVCVTNDEESFPYRLHSCNNTCDLKQYPSVAIKAFEGSSLWFNTWEDVAEQIIRRLVRHKKISQATIMDQISKVEKETLGFIRPEREGGINYAKRVYSRVMAYYQLKKNGYLEEIDDFDGAEQIIPQSRIDTVSMVKANSISDLFFSMLIDFGSNNGNTTSIKDWVDHLHRPYKQIANTSKPKKRSKITVVGNVNNAQEKLTKEYTENYGFLWEKAIWLYFINVLDQKGYSMEYYVDGDEFDQIPSRSDLRDNKTLTVRAYPPQSAETSKKAPLSLLWLGGVSQVDFSLSIDDHLFFLEAKSSTGHTCGSKKHPRCDCTIETNKINPLLSALNKDHDATAIILHLHGNYIGKQRTRTKAAKLSKELLSNINIKNTRSFSISKHTSVERWIDKTIPDIMSDIGDEQ